MKPLLDITGLRHQVGGFTLGELSLGLVAGDYMALLGPSGCGKTTLLKAIAGFYRTQAGTIRMDGVDMSGLAPHRRRVGYVSQSSDLFPHLNVARNIAFGLRYTKISPAEKQRRLDRIVGLLDIKDLLGRSPVTLSGGESKRVGLARSLVVNPRILLLDEPLSGIDHNARVTMLDTLKMMHDELGTATLHVTHSRDEAWHFNQHCAVMRNGRIEQIGAANDLFRKPATCFVAQFLGDTNVFPARFADTTAILDWAQFDLSAAPGFENGWLQIRPDTLSIQSQAQPGAIECVIKNIADHGTHTDIAARVASAVIVHAHTPRHHEFAVGQTAWLRCVEPPHPIPGDKA